MKDRIKETKEKILNTAVEIIGRNGIHKLTVRKVAELCNVNVASINYYFGSKDELIVQAIQYFLGNKITEVLGILDKTEYKPDQKLYIFLKNYMNVISKYPGIPKSIIANVLLDDLYLFNQMNDVLIGAIRKITPLIAEYLDLKDMEIAMVKTIQLLIPVFFPLTLYNVFRDIFPLDLYDEKTKNKYIKIILHGVLNKDMNEMDKFDEIKNDI